MSTRKTELVAEKEFKYHLIDQLKRLEKLTLSGGMLVGKSIIDDPVQKLLTNFERDTWFSSSFLPMMENCALDCELSAPGAGKTFLKLVASQLAKSIRSNIVFGSDFVDYEILIERVKEETIGLCDKKDFYYYIEQTCSKKSREIIKEALECYSPGDRVNVSRSSSRDTRIKREVGYTFDNVLFSPIYTNGKVWKREHVNVLLIDGIIETVGEVYHLLHKAHESKEPYLVICTGILPEVHDVFIQNFARGSIDVVIGTVKMDEFSIQALVDLGTVCMTEPITALKGETISSASNKELAKVEKVEILKNLTIKNEKAKNRTDRLIDEITTASIKNDDIKFLYQKRISALSSSKISISIGRDYADFDPSIVEDVDVFFRSCPMILSNGFIRRENVVDLDQEVNKIIFNETDLQPIFRIYKVLTSYNSFQAQIKSIGNLITTQRV